MLPSHSKNRKVLKTVVSEWILKFVDSSNTLDENNTSSADQSYIMDNGGTPDNQRDELHLYARAKI